jgi:hypothetical protein
MGLLVFPPWWINDEKPCCATSNTVTKFIGHAPVFAPPAQLVEFGDTWKPTICWPEFLGEVILSWLFVYAAVNCFKFPPGAAGTKSRWIAVAAGLVCAIYVMVCPPWWAWDEGKDFFFEKYSYSGYIGHNPFFATRRLYHLGGHSLEVKIAWSQLMLELFCTIVATAVLFHTLSCQKSRQGGCF